MQLTIDDATEIVRNYFQKNCKSLYDDDLYKFQVDHAVKHPTKPVFVIKCTHSCLNQFKDCQHEVAVNSETGAIEAVNRLL